MAVAEIAVYFEVSIRRQRERGGGGGVTNAALAEGATAVDIVAAVDVGDAVVGVAVPAAKFSLVVGLVLDGGGGGVKD